MSRSRTDPSALSRDDIGCVLVAAMLLFAVFGWLPALVLTGSNPTVGLVLWIAWAVDLLVLLAMASAADG